MSEAVMANFNATRAQFYLPESVIYLDGNSLGSVPLAAKDHIGKVIVEEWGGELNRGWSSSGGILQPRNVGNRIARLTGAPRHAKGLRHRAGAHCARSDR